jgi:hypothetical protein
MTFSFPPHHPYFAVSFVAQTVSKNKEDFCRTNLQSISRYFVELIELYILTKFSNYGVMSRVKNK